MNPAPTSKRLTLEFLSTLELNEVMDDPEDESLGTFWEVSFRLMNRDIKLDFRELNATFGWDTEAPTLYEAEVARSEEEQPRWVDLSGINAQTVWRRFTNDQIFESRKAKSFKIIHPAARYVHRLLVYSIYGRAELGAMTMADVKPLWLMGEARVANRPFPINYAEQFVARMLEIREGKFHRRHLVMGGMVTLLARVHVPGFTVRDVDQVSTSLLLDESCLVTTLRWLTYTGPDRFIWYVGDHDAVQAPWLILPDEASTRIEGCPRANPFHIPRRLDPEGHPLPAPLAPPAPAAVAAPEHQARPPPRAARRQAPGPASEPPMLQSILDEMAQMRIDSEARDRHLAREMDYLMTYTRGIYRSQVEAGLISEPYLNYPYHPPQQGPVPGWHGGRPTYPYHPPRPEGIDYRYPGGSDPAYDPNIPPFDSYPTYPSGYFSSVPPVEQTWGNAPMPPWGNYPDQPGSSSHMDEDQ